MGLNKKNSLADVTLAILVAIVCYSCVPGISTLNPINTSWLQGLDPMQHYLGWAFFRFSPWAIPPGLNPNFGLEIGSSIVYSDSIPIAAFIFKPFHSILSEPFQYLGLWTLISLFFQAFIALKICSLITKDLLIKAIFAIFITSSPILIHRIGLHTALTSHFLILAVIYLVISKKNSYALYLSLAILSLLIHFYLFAIVLFILLFHYMDRLLIQKNLKPTRFIGELTGLGIASLLIFYLAGYLSIPIGSGTTDVSYGFSKIDPIYLFNSQGWSYLLPYWDLDGPNNEGFIYLGLGLILLMPISTYANKDGRDHIVQFIVKNRFFFFSLVLLFIFSLTNKIELSYFKYSYELPGFLLAIANTLRSAPRMFWPIYYLLLMTILFLIIKRYQPSTAKFILVIALAIQIVDTSAGWLPLHKKYSHQSESMPKYPPVHNTKLNDPFWTCASKYYQNIRMEPLRESGANTDWETFSSYAAKNHMGVNSAYLARSDAKKIFTQNNHFLSILDSNQYDNNSLYILDRSLILRSLLSINPANHAVFLIDNFWVLIPNYKMHPDCLVDKTPIEASGYLKSLQLSNTIQFSTEVGSSLLYKGWSHTESWGRWSAGNSSELALPIPKDRPKLLLLRIRQPHIQNSINPSITIIATEGESNKLISLRENKDVIKINLEGIANNVTYIRIRFDIKNPVQPNLYSDSADNRELGIGLENARFY
jgi:hypothetical protein